MYHTVYIPVYMYMYMYMYMHDIVHVQCSLLVALEGSQVERCAACQKT